MKTLRLAPHYMTNARLANEVAKRMKIFLEVTSNIWNVWRHANSELNQEMEGKEADSSYLMYRVQPGIIDLNHLELVALENVSRGSWMPHFRLIPPS